MALARRLIIHAVLKHEEAIVTSSSSMFGPRTMLIFLLCRHTKLMLLPYAYLYLIRL